MLDKKDKGLEHRDLPRRSFACCGGAAPSCFRTAPRRWEHVSYQDVRLAGFPGPHCPPIVAMAKDSAHGRSIAQRKKGLCRRSQGQAPEQLIVRIPPHALLISFETYLWRPLLRAFSSHRRLLSIIFGRTGVE